jgi:hypothetical protein
MWSTILDYPRKRASGSSRTVRKYLSINSLGSGSQKLQKKVEKKNEIRVTKKI